MARRFRSAAPVVVYATVASACVLDWDENNDPDNGGAADPTTSSSATSSASGACDPSTCKCDQTLGGTCNAGCDANDPDLCKITCANGLCYAACGSAPKCEATFETTQPMSTVDCSHAGSCQMTCKLNAKGTIVCPQGCQPENDSTSMCGLNNTSG